MHAWSADDIYVNKLSACLAMNTASKRTNPKTNFCDVQTLSMFPEGLTFLQYPSTYD